jgi:Flp pilus assembly protein TadG
MSGTMGARRQANRERGQALVEFAISITVFLMLLMAIFDFGRAIYTSNGLAQAAREVARTASVYMGDTTWSAQAQATINTQKALVPGLTFPLWRCVASTAANDSAGTTGPCLENSYVVVTARSTYTPISLLGFLGTINLEAKSRVQVPLSQAK